MGESVTTPQTRAMLEAQPFIDVRKLAPDTKILVEAGPYIYELRILDGSGGVEVTSSDPRLKGPIVGYYLSGFYDADDIITLPWRIAPALRMKIRVRVCSFYLSAPVLSASLAGKGYHYEVF